MIKIKLHTIRSIVISTAMGHAGNGLYPFTLPLFPKYRELMRVARETHTTVFTKSSTPKRHAGNFRPWNPLTWGYIRRIGSNGLLNAYGLTNDGAGANAQKIVSAVVKDGLDVIPNIYPQFAEGQYLAIMQTLRAIEIYHDALCSLFWALEVNLSCPNDKMKIQENMTGAVTCVTAIRRQYPWLCLIAKISIVHSYEFAKRLIDAGVDIIHAINTIPYDLVYPKGPPSPLQTVGGGGVSGGPAFRQAYDYNEGLRQHIPGTPIIMGCGVTDLYDVRRYFSVGADAVSLCTVCRLNPEEAIKIIKEYAR